MSTSALLENADVSVVGASWYSAAAVRTGCVQFAPMSQGLCQWWVFSGVFRTGKIGALVHSFLSLEGTLFSELLEAMPARTIFQACYFKIQQGSYSLQYFSRGAR